MRFVYLVLMVVCLLSCSNDEQNKNYDPQCKACGVVNPQNKIGWLSKKIKTAKDDGKFISKVYVATYKGQDVFLFHRIYSSMAFFDEICDCQGNKIELSEAYEDISAKQDQWICIYKDFPY